MEPLLKAEHITVCYHETEIVKDVSFSLGTGEILGIAGESGSGKTTIIRSISGLLGPSGVVSRGDIFYKGENIVDISDRQRRQLSGPEIAVVFQDCKASFSPMRTIGAQMYEVVHEHHPFSKQEVFRDAEEIMRKVGLHDPGRILKSYPFELSGGMNQRVGICIAMLLKPKVLLCDEVTSALDVTVQKQVVEELLLMRKEYGTSIILVTHNIGVIRAMADTVLVLKNGEVKEYGEKEKVLNAPKDPYTKELMASAPRLKRSVL